jgi:DNA-binding response OmpR family regulator
MDERPFDLGRRESLLLEALLRANGRVVVRDQLEERLYGFNEPVTPNALEAAVSRLRRALVDAKTDLGIEALRGVGYRIRSNLTP